jgi:hypothetical protein
MDRVEIDVSNNSSTVVFVAAGMCLTNRCLATTEGIHIQTQGLMGGICEVRRRDRIRCHDIHTKFQKDWFRHSKVYKGETQTVI